MKLQNKIALVTGASKGLGKGIAKRFSAEGAVVVLASRNLTHLEIVEKEITASGRQSHSLEVDVRNLKSIQNAVEQTVDRYDRLDILVNNAGVSMVRSSEELKPEEWNLAIETNLSGVFFGCQAAACQMLKQGGGCIINISSMYGSAASPMRAAYCTSKAGVEMLTKVLAVEWAKQNIRVNAIAPGYLRTELVQELIDQGKLAPEALEKRTPQGRIGDVKDIVGAAVYLASEEASYTTGSIITIDGGWTAYGYI